MSGGGSPSDITQLLLELGASDRDGPAASDALYRAVYEELRRMAHGLMARERPGHTLQPTALVHEAYLKLVDDSRTKWTDRAHFFGIAARAMRQILVDHARRHRARKRGGDRQRVPLEDDLHGNGGLDLEVLVVHDALEKLAREDERMARVVELRIFAGLGAKEVAHVLGFSKRTVDEDWKMARMWLARELAEESSP